MRYAAVDIGSNSIRMLAAEVVPDEPPRILAAHRQVTRLGESVFRTGRFSQESIDLACAVLSRMAAQYRELGVIAVRAVATSSARDARNQAEFITRTSEALGVPVEVISGREEARLIHLGVQSRWPHPDKNLLVIDIGGGSMEIIAGEGGRFREALSKPLGAVRLRELLLDADPPTRDDLHRLREYIDERLGSLPQWFGRTKWDRAIATSGSASAAVCAVNRVPVTRRESADRLRASVADIRRLYKKLSQMDVGARRRVTGIGPKRAEIIIPGLAVLLRALQFIGVQAVHYSSAGLRDGIVADLAARRAGAKLSVLSRDQRLEIEQMSRRYGVSVSHGRKVAAIANSLFTWLQPLHKLPPGEGKLLQAAAYLHDVGHYVNDASHHKHSYYLVANSDLPGFTSRERELIANLCRYHRKALPSAAHQNFKTLRSEDQRALLYLVPLLRIADSLDRTHDQRVDAVRCRLDNGRVSVEIAAPGDTDLDEWAARREADVFREIYGRPIEIERTSR